MSHKPKKVKRERKISDEYLASPTAEPVLQTALLGLTTLFPSAAPFTGLLSSVLPSRKLMRAEKQLKEVFQRLEQLELVLDEEWINSEEFGFLFEECLRGFQENYQKEKIDAFKAILLKACSRNDFIAEEREYYLGLVHRLTPLHIKLLKLLDEGRKFVRGATHAAYPSVKDTLGVDINIIVAAYADLEILQFTNTPSSSISSYLTVPLERMECRISKAAVDFIEFISL